MAPTTIGIRSVGLRIMERSSWAERVCGIDQADPIGLSALEELNWVVDIFPDGVCTPSRFGVLGEGSGDSFRS